MANQRGKCVWRRCTIGCLVVCMATINLLVMNSVIRDPSELTPTLRYQPDVKMTLNEVHRNASGPGESGKGVFIDPNELTLEEKKSYKEGIKLYAYNEMASDMISLHRRLKDVRGDGCKSVQYDHWLPETSVILCAYNEAWSVLLRTVHSILDNSPPHLVKEIILVDDFSTLKHLKQPLDDYMDLLDKVRVVHSKRREGLIRARLLGASMARGQVLTFLDAHCECTTGWLEPLLGRIAQNTSNVVMPIIDTIHHDTFQYIGGNQPVDHIIVGGFDWHLHFQWIDRPLGQIPTAPRRSPTMAGGLFAISRSYFEYLGTYDSAMDIWGGENLELSFRIWMCGGTLELIPCSHVGHVFRDFMPYSSHNSILRNTFRVAEVWLDEYKSNFYNRVPKDVNMTTYDYGDVSQRRELRTKLKCKSFDWYMKNIYPEKYNPVTDMLKHGEIRSKVTAMCMDKQMSSNHNVWSCHGNAGNQYWEYTRSGEIMNYLDQCLEFLPLEHRLVLNGCNHEKQYQHWKYGTDHTVKNKKADLCMELTEDWRDLHMQNCTGIDRQIWIWNAK